MLALAALASLVGWPLYRLFKGLHKRGRLPDMKRSRVTISSAILVAILLAFFLVPLPISRVRQTGLVQIEPELVHKVTVPSDGQLVALHVRDGQRVVRGQPIADFRNPKLEADLQTALGNLKSATAQYDSNRRRFTASTDPEEQKQWESEASSL